MLDRFRERIRHLHYSLRTEQTVVHWVRYYIRAHRMQRPTDMGGAAVEAFLSWLASRCARRSCYCTGLVWRRTQFTFFAFQRVANLRLPALRRDYPGPLGPRRIMAHMLVMAASEPGDPVALCILMETGNELFQVGSIAILEFQGGCDARLRALLHGHQKNLQRIS